MSEGEKIGQENMFPSMPKWENVENSCQLMSKEFSNDKRITSKHDDTMNLVNDKGIPKLDCRSMTGSTTMERSAK